VFLHKKQPPQDPTGFNGPGRGHLLHLVPKQSKFLNLEQAAEHLNCSLSTLRRMLRRKQLSYYQVGRKIYLDRTEIRKDLQSYRRASRYDAAG
jgi:excisionase family DNA binding protein